MKPFIKKKEELIMCIKKIITLAVCSGILLASNCYALSKDTDNSCKPAGIGLHESLFDGPWVLKIATAGGTSTSETGRDILGLIHARFKNGNAKSVDGTLSTFGNLNGLQSRTSDIASIKISDLNKENGFFVVTIDSHRGDGTPIILSFKAIITRKNKHGKVLDASGILTSAVDSLGIPINEYLKSLEMKRVN